MAIATGTSGGGMNAAESSVMIDALQPSGLGNDLLVEWGQWYRDDRDGREAWSVKPRVDPGFHGTPPESAQIVDKIVSSHRLKYQRDWSIIAQRYLDDRMPWEIAKRMNWPEARVLTLLVCMCGMAEREYRDRKSVDNRIKVRKNRHNLCGIRAPA